VRCLLGPTAISNDKVACSNPLDLLGVDTFMSKEGVRFKPSEEKVVKWSHRIHRAIETGTLLMGDASKLGGTFSPSCCVWRHVLAGCLCFFDRWSTMGSSADFQEIRKSDAQANFQAMSHTPGHWVADS